MSKLYKFFCTSVLLTSGFFSKGIIKKDIDYSEYLGKGYEVPSNFGTVISNHSTPLDSTIMGFLYDTIMVSKSAYWDVPIIGWAITLLETIYVDRGDPQSKQKTIDLIKLTQSWYLEGKSNKILGIFPEGTTTNNTALLSFKQGAFISLTPVKPLVFLIKSKYISPTYDCVGFLELFILICL